VKESWVWIVRIESCGQKMNGRLRGRKSGELKQQDGAGSRTMTLTLIERCPQQNTDTGPTLMDGAERK